MAQPVGPPHGVPVCHGRADIADGELVVRGTYIILRCTPCDRHPLRRVHSSMRAPNPACAPVCMFLYMCAVDIEEAAGSPLRLQLSLILPATPHRLLCFPCSPHNHYHGASTRYFGKGGCEAWVVTSCQRSPLLPLVPVGCACHSHTGNGIYISCCVLDHARGLPLRRRHPRRGAKL